MKMRFWMMSYYLMYRKHLPMSSNLTNFFFYNCKIFIWMYFSNFSQ